MKKLDHSRKEKLQSALKAAKALGYDVLGQGPDGDLTLYTTRENLSSEQLIEKMKLYGYGFVTQPAPKDPDELETFNFSFFLEDRIGQQSSSPRRKSRTGPGPAKWPILFFMLWFGTMYVGYEGITYASTNLFCPSDAFFCGYERAADFLRFMPGMIIAFIIAFAGVSLLSGSQEHLDQTGRFVVFLVVGICLLLMLWGNLDFFYLKDSKIGFRTLFSPTTDKIYAWNDVRRINTECYRGGRSSFNRAFTLNFNDAESIELSLEDNRGFKSAYSKLHAALGDRPIAFINEGCTTNPWATKP